MSISNLYKHFPILYSHRITLSNRGCMYFFLATLLLHLLIFVSLLYFLVDEDEFLVTTKYPCDIDLFDNIKTLGAIATDVGFNLILLEKVVVNSKLLKNKSVSYKCIDCSQCRPLVKIALDFGSIADKSKKNQVGYMI